MIQSYYEVGAISKLRLLEPVFMFVGIMAYIWELRFTHPWAWIPLVGWILLSHVIRHERPPALGFRLTNLRDCLRIFGPILLALIFALSIAGVEFGTVRPIGAERGLFSLALYLPWGLFQQYLLNGYFLKRFDTVLAPRPAGVVTAALFATVHSPNWFLMLVTLVAGYAAIQVYRRYANLYFLAIAHAALGFLLFMVVPDSVSHHLNVGPGAREYSVLRVPR